MFAVLNTGDVLGSWIPGGRGIPQFPKCDVGGGWLHRTSVTAALKQHCWVRLPFPKRSSWWPNLSWCVSSDRMVLAVVRFHWKRGNSFADSGHLNKEEGVCQAQSPRAQNKDPSTESRGCPVNPTRWAYPPIHPPSSESQLKLGSPEHLEMTNIKKTNWRWIGIYNKPLFWLNLLNIWSKGKYLSSILVKTLESFWPPIAYSPISCC